MRIIKIITISLMVLPTHTAFSQNKPSRIAFSGHLETLELVWIEDFDTTWQTMGTLYNRLNFSWYPSNTFTFRAGMRNILDYGQIVSNVNTLAKILPNQPGYKNLVVTDDGFFDLTKAWASGNSYTLYSNIDRLNLNFTKGSFEATIGRQRINWGINLVWNPNDIFNVFNYFNFDYVERPGCDAVRLHYYTGMTSTAELGFKIDHENKITLAGMYKFNLWNYDFQFLGGVMEDDFVAGLGWSGQIEGAGFNGEASYFHDIDNFSDTSAILVTSIGINYSFKNNLYLQASFLYNSNGTTGPAGMGNMFVTTIDISAKNLTLARFSTFFQASYPFTPLINSTLAGMFNPNDKSAFIGPSVEFSIKDNLSFLIIGQVFIGDKGTEFGDYGTMFYMRLKWSF